MITIRFLSLRSPAGERRLRPNEMRNQETRLARVLEEKGIEATMKTGGWSIKLSNLQRPRKGLKNPLTNREQQAFGAWLQQHYQSYLPNLIVSIKVN